MRLLVFLLGSLLRGRLAFAVWELCEVAEQENLARGDVQEAANVRCSWPARWARARLTADGLDLVEQARRLRAIRSAIEPRL